MGTLELRRKTNESEAAIDYLMVTSPVNWLTIKVGDFVPEIFCRWYENRHALGQHAARGKGHERTMT